MFKKNVWVVGLLAVLAIMLMGCVDALPPTEGEIVELVNLQSIIADKPDGVIEDNAAWGKIFKDTPFQKCGNPTFTIITDGGVKKLKVDGMTANWGEGLDLYNDDYEGNSGVGFRAGDEITILGTVNPVGNGLKIGNGSGKAKFDGWTSGASFEKTYALTQNNIGEIRGASPKAVRLSYADPDGDARKGTIIFEQIIVKGLRGGGQEDVFIDDFTISGLVQEAGWVEGLQVKPNKGKTTGKIAISYRNVTAATTDPWTTDLDDVQLIGTYDAKFTVAGTKGFKAASFDGYQMRVLAVAPTPLDDTAPMSKIKSIGTINSLLGKGFAFLWNNGNGDAAKTLALKVPTANPIAVRAYSGGYAATPRILYPLPTDWNAFDELRITYEAINTDIPTTESPSGNDSNAAFVSAVIAADGSLANRPGSTAYPDLTNDYGLVKKISGNTYQITIPTTHALLGGASVNGFVITKNHDFSGLLIKLTRVEMYYK